MNTRLVSFFEFKIPAISYIILMLVVFLLFLFDNHFLPLSSSSSQIGSLILFFGFGVRVIATKTSKYMGKIKVTGIYAICRQPLLLAQIISLIGLNIIVSNIYFMFISMILFVCNDLFAAIKYDKILSHHYKDIWTIYAKYTHFLMPISSHFKDIFSKSFEKDKYNNSNIVIFCLIYLILVEIAIFSNL